MTPLVEHLSPKSTSGFLSVCVLVTDVVSTAVRGAKMNIKHCITKHTGGRNWRMKVWIQIQEPKEAKFHKGRGSSEGCYSTWPQVGIKVWNVHNHCLTAHFLGDLEGEMWLCELFLQSQG